MTETQKEHAILQAMVHGIVFAVATSDNEFGQWYVRSRKNRLVAHGAAAVVAWILCVMGTKEWGASAA
jgi:hypothetical protein